MSDKEAQAIVFDKDKFETSVVGEIATVTYNDKTAYIDGLGFTKEELKRIAKHDEQYLKTFTAAASEKANEMMLEDKGINKVILSAPFTVADKGSIDVSVDRSKTFNNRFSDSGPVVKSVVNVCVNVPYHELSKSYIKSLEAKVTESLLK